MKTFLLLSAATVLASATMSAQQASVPAPAPAPARSASVVLPGTRETAFSTIQGNVLNSTNGAIPNSLVRLRDARTGRIVNTQLTDKSGLFSFRAVEPGNYVVELMGHDKTVLAASELLSVNAGEAISTLIKLPFPLAALGGVFGHTAAQAATVISAAAATGILNVATTTDVSPDGTR